MERLLKNIRYFGFLGFFSILGFRYFQTDEWSYLLFFPWVLWFAFFIPGLTKWKDNYDKK